VAARWIPNGSKNYPSKRLISVRRKIRSSTVRASSRAGYEVNNYGGLISLNAHQLRQMKFFSTSVCRRRSPDGRPRTRLCTLRLAVRHLSAERFLLRASEEASIYFHHSVPPPSVHFSNPILSPQPPPHPLHCTSHILYLCSSLFPLYHLSLDPIIVGSASATTERRRAYPSTPRSDSHRPRFDTFRAQRTSRNRIAVMLTVLHTPPACNPPSPAPTFDDRLAPAILPSIMRLNPTSGSTSSTAATPQLQLLRKSSSGSCCPLM